MVELRAEMWEKSFSRIRGDFEFKFLNHMTEQDKIDLDAILNIRNAIAHSRVFIHRDYFLYRPSGGQRKEENIISSLNIPDAQDRSDPTMLSLRFYNDDEYQVDFERINRIHKLIGKVAESLGVPHGQLQ